jgi:hypothetical protein
MAYRIVKPRLVFKTVDRIALCGMFITELIGLGDDRRRLLAIIDLS